MKKFPARFAVVGDDGGGMSMAMVEARRVAGCRLRFVHFGGRQDSSEKHKKHKKGLGWGGEVERGTHAWLVTCVVCDEFSVLRGEECDTSGMQLRRGRAELEWRAVGGYRGGPADAVGVSGGG